VKLDPDLNELSMPDADIAAPGSDVRVLVIAAHEELIAARAVRALLEAST
jgi:acetate kinase